MSLPRIHEVFEKFPKRRKVKPPKKRRIVLCTTLNDKLGRDYVEPGELHCWVQRDVQRNNGLTYWGCDRKEVSE